MRTNEPTMRHLEKSTAEATPATTEQLAREKLTAIRALCDIVLDEKINSTKLPATNLVSTTVSSPVYTQPVAIPSQKLEEEDANGDSLFDF